MITDGNDNAYNISKTILKILKLSKKTKFLGIHN